MWSASSALSAAAVLVNVSMRAAATKDSHPRLRVVHRPMSNLSISAESWCDSELFITAIQSGSKSAALNSPNRRR